MSVAEVLALRCSTPSMDLHCTQETTTVALRVAARSARENRLGVFIHEANPHRARLPTDRGSPHWKEPHRREMRMLLSEFLVKTEYAYDYGMPQLLATVDRLLAPLHLESIFFGKAQILSLPQWYRERATRYMREVLLDPRARHRDYFQGRAWSSWSMPISMDDKTGLEKYTVS